MLGGKLLPWNLSFIEAIDIAILQRVSECQRDE